jgi:hypothetical protein
MKSKLKSAIVYEGLNVNGLGKCWFANAQPSIQRSRSPPQGAIDGYQELGTHVNYNGIPNLPNFGQAKPNFIK